MHSGLLQLADQDQIFSHVTASGEPTTMALTITLATSIAALQQIHWPANLVGVADRQHCCWTRIKPLADDLQVKAALEQQNGAPPTDEEVFAELLTKSMVEKDTIRSAMAAAKQAAEEKAAAEAAGAAEQAAAAEAEAPAAEDAAAAE